MFSLLLLPLCWCLASGYNAQNERQTATAGRQSKPGKLAYDQGNPSSNPSPDPSQSQCWRFCLNIVAQFQLFYCYFNVAKAPKKLPLRVFQILHN